MKEKNTYDSNIAEKANTALAKCLRKKATDVRALAEFLGCSTQAVNQYKQGTAFPKTENLIKIAQYFNVSLDYLCGLSASESRDVSLSAAVDYTGLSVEAVEALHNLTEKENEGIWGCPAVSGDEFNVESVAYAEVLNSMLSSSLFADLIEAFVLATSSKQFIDLYKDNERLEEIKNYLLKNREIIENNRKPLRSSMSNDERECDYLLDQILIAAERAFEANQMLQFCQVEIFDIQQEMNRMICNIKEARTSATDYSEKLHNFADDLRYPVNK